MDINSLFRFGNLAVNMLGTPQFKKMAKFAVPFLSAPAQPAEGVTGDGAAPAPQAPPAVNHSSAAAHPWGAGPWGAPRPPQRPGMPQFGAARPGMPGRGGHPRLGGLEALRGFMGGGAPGQRPPGMGMQNPGQPGNLPAGIPVKNLMKYATPQNLQKVMEWQKVAKQVMGMFGGSAAATTAAAAATTSATRTASGLKTASGRQSLKPAQASRTATAAKRTAKKSSPARSGKSKSARSSIGSKKSN